MKYLIFAVTIVFAAISVHAQDKIFRKNGQILKAKIIEIGSADIKYKPMDNPDGPVYVLEKDRVTKIEFEDGRVEKVLLDLKDPEFYKDQQRKAIKFSFIAPLIGYSEFSYEKSVAVGRSYELALGIIGMGKSQQIDWYNSGLATTRKNQFGLYAGAGYKFNKLPDFLFGRTRLTHIMQGSYAKPQVYLGNYSENALAYKGGSQYVIKRRNITFAAIQMEFGKQWVFGDKLLVDSFWGFGYGFDNKGRNYTLYAGEDEESAYNYGVSRLGRSPGVAFTFGLRIGLLVK